jgi:prepilin-type N-terminal cleavage/methylation domain-containing protein
MSLIEVLVCMALLPVGSALLLFIAWLVFGVDV